MTALNPADRQLAPKDYASDQEVRWCPGCGDYAILKGVQKALSEIGADPDKTVFVSGIGCAARFPYYMETYGFHTIHGRAPGFATGIKLANPELDVWLVSGDGDALSIGGNHLLHLLRRNVNVQFLLFNNEIYGLTKGQYSPTSRMGTRSPSTPYGSVELPVLTTAFAIGSGARFVARSVDTDQKRLPGVLQRAHAHEGTSFVEIMQNCIVYNDGVFSEVTGKDVSDDMQLHLEHGQPMIFGKDRDKGIRLQPGKIWIETVTLGKDGVTEDDLLVHDETNVTLAALLAGMRPPRFPVPLGVLYCNPRTPYEISVREQMSEAAAKSKSNGDMNALLRRGYTWTVD